MSTALWQNPAMGAIEQTREATTAIGEIWIEQRILQYPVASSSIVRILRAPALVLPFFHSRGSEEISPQVGRWVRKEICAYVHFFLDLGQQCAI